MEENGVVFFIKDGDGFSVKEEVAAFVAEWATPKRVCLNEGMILPLQTGSVGRRWSA
jgi:hypothetical protein